MNLGITGKRALVLGASKGLGAASARALLAEGVEVHAVSRSGAVSAAGMTAVAANLSDAEGVQHVIDHIASVGQIDILVANSGGPRPGPVHGVSADEWRRRFNGPDRGVSRQRDSSWSLMGRGRIRSCRRQPSRSLVTGAMLLIDGGGIRSLLRVTAISGALH